jgi:hypothetical protein
MNSGFTLGQRVTFTHTLRRATKGWTTEAGGGWEKVWAVDRADCRWARGDVIPQTGIIIGLRTLSNGIATDNGPDTGSGYMHKQNVPAALIATGLRRRPVFVPLDAVQAVPA